MPEPSDLKQRPRVPKPSAARGTSSFPYAELDVTTNFSFLRGASHPDELVYRAAELGYTAVAVTDVNSLAGIVRAHQAAKESSIQLCVGARLCFTDSPDVLVWAENRGGYASLCRLLTLGKRRAEKGSCTLQLEDLLATPAGLWAAVVPQRIDPHLALADPERIEKAARFLKEAFGGRLSISISRLYGPTDRMVLDHANHLSRAFGIPLLATNQVHYHHQGRHVLQDVVTCIRHGCTMQDAGFRLFPNGERFLKPPEEMHDLFWDLPAALRRSVEIAQACSFSLDELKYEYPDEIVPPGKTVTGYLTELTWEKAAGRYPNGISEKVRKHIVHELELIEQLKIEPYFLTVYDLVRFARSRGILCQGRGSAANSVVCYCLGVTSVDPEKIDVLFERFVSSARAEPPDIDLDFEHERREEVIQYVYEKYGRERAGMTAESISYRGRSAVRDVGKAMGLGLDAVDQLAKQLEGWHSGAPLDDQIRAAGLDPTDRTVQLVVALTRELLGFPRHLSQHVGGMIITRGLLCELVPIENASMEDRTVIEWDKDDIDTLGIFKIDVLALGMLTCISKALKLLNEKKGEQTPVSEVLRRPGSILEESGSSEYLRTGVFQPCLDLYTMPREDPGVYDMICDADTIGVFQIESRAQMSMLPRLKPREFYDLVIEVAIVRPGPIQGNMVHPYLRRREGLDIAEYPHPALEEVLGKTLGVPLFQEQAMKIAMVAAGFSAVEADRLRRAVTGFRRYGDIDTFQEQFINGMVSRDYEKEFAERCFAQLKGFSTYGFPESHAASFAILVYASCWIKRYHPAVFCCAILNSQPMGFYAPAQLVRDAKEHGVEIRPVDVNYSDWDCKLEERQATTKTRSHEGKHTWGWDGPAMRLGFRMIKGFKLIHAERIVSRRQEIGAFRSVDHFHAMTELPVTAVAKLSEADAFSSLPKTRRVALWETLALPEERKPLSVPAENNPTAPALPLMTLGQEIHTDYGTIGLSLKGHPVGLLREELNRRKVVPAAQVWDRPHGRWIRVAGIVVIRQRPGTAKGIVFETLEDETGVVNLILRPQIFDRYHSTARHASFIQADGYVQRVGKVQHILAMRLHDLSEMLSNCSLRSRDFH